MKTQWQAYIDGWNAVMNGEDARGGLRYAREFADGNEEISYAWTHGAMDAMDAEDGEEPEPASAGYASIAEATHTAAPA